MKLTYKQAILLDEWGGRNEKDVFVDENNKLYVNMTNGYEDTRVYIDEQLTKKGLQTKMDNI